MPATTPEQHSQRVRACPTSPSQSRTKHLSLSQARRARARLLCSVCVATTSHITAAPSSHAHRSACADTGGCTIVQLAASCEHAPLAARSCRCKYVLLHTAQGRLSRMLVPQRQAPCHLSTQFLPQDITVTIGYMSGRAIRRMNWNCMQYRGVRVRPAYLSWTGAPANARGACALAQITLVGGPGLRPGSPHMDEEKEPDEGTRPRARARARPTPAAAAAARRHLRSPKPSRIHSARSPLPRGKSPVHVHV